MQGRTIRDSLHAGDRVYGTHVCSLTNPLTARMQASLPYDFVFICNEHMPIDRTETGMMCQFYAAQGISPVVRIPYAEPHWAAMALDGGAQGIVAPYVETVDEVRALVGAVKYRPIKGRQLRDYLDGTRPMPGKIREFLERFNADSYLIIGVESVAAYEALDELMAVPGVDGVFVGPHDMTVSMEIPEEYDHPEFDRVLRDIVRRCREANLGVGVHFGQTVVEDKRFDDLLDEGMNWVLYGADVALLVSDMQARLSRFRKRMGDRWQPDDNQGPKRPSSCVVPTED